MGEHIQYNINIYLLILLGTLMYLVLQDPLGDYFKDYCTVDINETQYKGSRGFYLYGHLVRVVQEVLGDLVDLEPHRTQRLYRVKKKKLLIPYYLLFL